MRKEITILLLIVGAFALIQTFKVPVASTGKDSHLLIQTNDETYNKNVEEAGDWVLLDFWAPWCGPCLKLKPTINEIAEEQSDSLKVLAVNVDEATNIANNYGISSIPTLVMLYKGREVARRSGGMPKKAFEIWIESAKAEITP